MLKKMSNMYIYPSSEFKLLWMRHSHSTKTQQYLGSTHSFITSCNHCKVSKMHKYHSAIMSLAKRIDVALIC